ncbi:Cloroperoxidase [Pseudohyphozyma bogoriensis]|nr:Cloroperoxidase [Pseudohyphozyma bogoriensis]
MLWTAVVLVPLASASAFANHNLWQHPLGAADSVDFTQWHPSVPTDVRGPSDASASLANHGILPRDGKNLTIPILKKALKDGLNVGHDFSQVIGTLALKGCKPPGSTSFNLDELAQHGTVEHDGSISRGDFKVTGNNKDFNGALFDEWLKVAAPNGEKQITLPAAAAGRWARLKQCNATNPDFEYDQKFLSLSYGESALYLSTMGHPYFANPPTHFVEILFREERLPWIEGWRPPHAETNIATVTAMIFRIKQANPTEATQAEKGGLAETVLDLLMHKKIPSTLPCWHGGEGC